MKNIWKELYAGFFEKEHFWKRLLVMTIAVIIMGFCTSWLLLIDLGTDPCTLMNNAIAAKIGTSLGNWQAFMNTVLLVIVVILGGRNLGFGTIINMLLVGYSIDFFSWIWASILPEGCLDALWIRLLILIPAITIFVLAVAVYTDMNMGIAPYDAVPFLVSARLPKVPFKIIRIVFDAVVTTIGLLFGGKLGIVTFLMILALGPVIEWVGKLIARKWNFTDSVQA